MSDSSCPICYEAFVKPKMMTCCGQSICQRCEHRYSMTNTQPIAKINCPVCGKEGAFDVTELRSVNIGLQQLLEHLDMPDLIKTAASSVLQYSPIQKAELLEPTDQTKSTTEKEDIEKCLPKEQVQVSMSLSSQNEIKIALNPLNAPHSIFNNELLHGLKTEFLPNTFECQLLFWSLSMSCRSSCSH